MMFRLSCMDGDSAATRRHLDSGTVNVNYRDVEIARLLLNTGADPFAVDEMRPDRAVTALDLHWAVVCPSSKVIQKTKTAKTANTAQQDHMKRWRP